MAVDSLAGPDRSPGNPVPSLTWRRTSAYSVASGDYAVSRSTVLDSQTGALVDRFSAWVGLDLLEQPRETSRPAELLGIRRSGAEAKALCEDHASVRHGRQAPDAPG